MEEDEEQQNNNGNNMVTRISLVHPINRRRGKNKMVKQNYASQSPYNSALHILTMHYNPFTLYIDPNVIDNTFTNLSNQS